MFTLTLDHLTGSLVVRDCSEIYFAGGVIRRVNSGVNRLASVSNSSGHFLLFSVSTLFLNRRRGGWRRYHPFYREGKREKTDRQGRCCQTTDYLWKIESDQIRSLQAGVCFPPYKY